MSTSTQHDDASRKRKRDAAQDSESEGIDDTTKRIRGLTRILEEPDSNRISDEAILFYATSAIEFMDDFESLVTDIMMDISISNPEGILIDIGMDGFGRLFIKRGKESDRTYHEYFHSIAASIRPRWAVLKAIKELLGQVHKLPGISPCISIDVDFQKFFELCGEAEEKLGQKISDTERMIEFYQELRIRDAWTADALKSTSVLELLQLRPDDVKALEELTIAQEIADFLKKKLEPFKELHGLIRNLEAELSGC
ncbi:hypothetical protein B0H65DRAFT_506786 [Neurospora tetraspora]|uniref:Uncharacterized protein n=1 Tax=Neurospora tetraspora TaxID=94610 RepID=A0AAE0JKJ6_9PEZI|nr:hypothetical protein B0H65DRAFT_506786 [Neurospora tetraspora]